MEHRLINIQKLLIGFLNDKLKHYSGLAQAEKMTANEKANWALVMEEAYKDKFWVTYARMEKILTLGCSGHYGEFPNLNKKVLTSWINQFYRDNQHEIDSEQRSRMQEKERNQVDSIQHYLKVGKESFLKRVAPLYNAKSITLHDVPEDIDLGNLWFKYCHEAGLIDLDQTTIEQITKGKSITLQHQERARRINSGLEGDLKITINPSSVEAAAKHTIMRIMISKWINQGIDIDQLFRKHGVYEIREKYFFAPMVNKM